MEFLVNLKQIRMQVAKYFEICFVFIGWTHMFRLFRRHLNTIVCKTSLLKFSIALKFFTCALLKKY